MGEAPAWTLPGLATAGASPDAAAGADPHAFYDPAARSAVLRRKAREAGLGRMKGALRRALQRKHITDAERATIERALEALEDERIEDAMSILEELAESEEEPAE